MWTLPFRGRGDGRDNPLPLCGGEVVDVSSRKRERGLEVDLLGSKSGK